MLDGEVFEQFQNELSNYMTADLYNAHGKPYQICNIYYDTDDNYLIRQSLSKPLYKEKLRLRSYGVPDKSGRVFIEIKKKFRGKVNKRRSEITLCNAYDFLESGLLSKAYGLTNIFCTATSIKHDLTRNFTDVAEQRTALRGIHPHMNEQVLKETAAMLSQYKLSPKVYISYDRRAYFSKDDSDLRLSVDSDIRTRRSDLYLESGIYGDALLKDGQKIMEIKTAGSFPLWLVDLLSKYRIYPVSFSKYGTEYKYRIMQLHKNKEENHNICSIPYSQAESAKQSILAY